MGKIETITPAPNMAVWDVLSKTDPAHTKGFKRGGGFSGTAIKPMWAWQRLTEMYGPFGVGWGCDKPEYQVIPAGNEILVYCTVCAWHGARDNLLWGVGGDKVIAVFSSGPKADDEAFKKAFTDALMNAFKFIGVGADVHMGRFDDNKYVAEMNKEFHPAPHDEETPPAKPVKLAGPYTSKSALWTAYRAFAHTVEGCGDLGEFLAFVNTDDSRALQVQIERDAPNVAETGENLPGEFEPMKKFLKRKHDELSAAEDDSWKRDVTRAG